MPRVNGSGLFQKRKKCHLLFHMSSEILLPVIWHEVQTKKNIVESKTNSPWSSFIDSETSAGITGWSLESFFQPSIQVWLPNPISLEPNLYLVSGRVSLRRVLSYRPNYFGLKSFGLGRSGSSFLLKLSKVVPWLCLNIYRLSKYYGSSKNGWSG